MVWRFRIYGSVGFRLRAGELQLQLGSSHRVAMKVPGMRV